LVDADRFVPAAFNHKKVTAGHKKISLALGGVFVNKLANGNFFAQPVAQGSLLLQAKTLEGFAKDVRLVSTALPVIWPVVPFLVPVEDEL
tara:strand:+ start:1251 stop:1520 length:270 start_codon:yes stop_codon:yes gene_type:complete